jgi:poly-gamma-glutamate capsule biosynthesis protein CapA/YwtB (metallophosphatase superfamily)
MQRREFLIWSSKPLLGVSFSTPGSTAHEWGNSLAAGSNSSTGVPAGARLTLFLAGDVMTGRGIDQILPHSVDPQLHEPYVKSAKTYVELAEEEHGPIPDGVSYDYVWGDALDELARVHPDVRIINLETAITTSDDWWRGKGIHYRMHPKNVSVLTTAGIDVCALGNNHVMDWGHSGLLETLGVLQRAGLQTPGAGLNRKEAAAPAVLNTRSGRLLVFSYGSPSAGVPLEWQANEDQPGVNLLPDLSPQRAQEVIEHIERYRRADDRVVISLHWGENWGYDVPRSQQVFAHRLVDAGAADIIHGHSSHHPKGIEVYQGPPILYGCGDFLNDYEGIGGKEAFRGDLTVMYFPTMDGSGALVSLEMTPMRIRRFRLVRASKEEASWLMETLDRESRRFGARVAKTPEGRLALRWG